VCNPTCDSTMVLQSTLQPTPQMRPVVLSRAPHSNCRTTDTNRSLRPGGGRLETSVHATVACEVCHRTAVQHSSPSFTIVHHLNKSAYHVRYATASGAVDVWHANRCRDNSCEAKQGARATEQTTDACKDERSNMHCNPYVHERSCASTPSRQRPKK